MVVAIFLPQDFSIFSDKMASVSTVLQEIGKDFLECGICFERYTNPKILSCVHSFCEKCLVQYYGNDVVKTCPVCRQETRLPVPGGISGLKTNGFIITLREKIELQEKVAKTSSDKAERKMPCEICTENEVTHHCLNCSQNICQGCMKSHRRIKVSADHTVGTLEDIREGKVTLPEEQKEYTCNKHKGEINRFYCETCHVLICRDCVVVDHCKPKHQYIDRAVASAKYKKFWEQIFPVFSSNIEYSEICLEDEYNAQQKFERKTAQTVKEVKKGADWVRDKVKAEEDRLLGEIRVLKKDRTAAIKEHIKSIKSLLQRKQHTLAIARDVTNKGSDSDFLSLFPIINQDLNFLSRYVPPQFDANFHYQRLDHTGSIKLGKLNLGSKWELRCEVGGDLGRYGPMSFWDVTVLPGDTLAGTTTDGRMAIFNTGGGLEKTIKLPSGRHYGIASFHSCPVVADDDGNVQIYNHDFTLASRFCVVPLELSLHSWTHLSFQPMFAAHTSICVRKDDTLLVGYPSRNMILIKPTMNGQPVSYCRGVCCHSSGIYVAVVKVLDSDSGYDSHIHRYDGDGKFLSCIIQGLSHPNGITFTEDGHHLTVVDGKIVKIYRAV
ncbi:E3 ubiquitin-protein ligase TRIM56-like [Asterias amurensis]|uniref:E3 ubiquitin-protein ligase TRIM56-like n=1 Tax=Asterias amurensis TaxID=7602 RepID=UPI003AB6CC1D